MSWLVGTVISMGVVLFGYAVYLIYCWVKEDAKAKWYILVLIGWLGLSCYLFWVLEQWWVIFVWVIGYAIVVFYPAKKENNPEDG